MCVCAAEVDRPDSFKRRVGEAPAVHRLGARLYKKEMGDWQQLLWWQAGGDAASSGSIDRPAWAPV